MINNFFIWLFNSVYIKNNFIAGKEIQDKVNFQHKTSDDKVCCEEVKIRLMSLNMLKWRINLVWQGKKGYD
jgi:hypothetical protein